MISFDLRKSGACSNGRCGEWGARGIAPRIHELDGEHRHKLMRDYVFGYRGDRGKRCELRELSAVVAAQKVASGPCALPLTLSTTLGYNGC